MTVGCPSPPPLWMRSDRLAVLWHVPAPIVEVSVRLAARQPEAHLRCLPGLRRANTEVLARAASLEIASAAYMAAVAEHSLRNVQLHHGAGIVKRHDGEPEPPPNPNLRS